MKPDLIVEKWPIERLQAYARNPRKNDDAVDKMAEVIREFGFRFPVVAKSDGTLVDGHLRLKAASKLGLKEIPVALADDLTETQIKAFRLLVNQSATWADWDDDLLKLELGDIKLDNFDLDIGGLDDLVKEPKHNVGIGSWHMKGHKETLCDIQKKKIALHSLGIIGSGFISCFERSDTEGVPLSQIKKEESSIHIFAEAAVEALGKAVKIRDANGWEIACPPPRRHKEWNFADMVCREISVKTGIFYSGSDVFSDKSRNRFAPKLTLERDVSQNIILFDDILTTGSTIKGIHEILKGKNIVTLIGIVNK